jgi:hypothetical protein
VSLEDDPAGWALLTSPAIGELLEAAVGHSGGRLRSWRLSEVEANPGEQTTATYTTTVDWPFGSRAEVVGVSARAGGAAGSDADAVIFAAGQRQVAVWLYPGDPDLPGLARAAFREGVAAILTELRLVAPGTAADRVSLGLVGYRPRRQAVLRASVHTSAGPDVFYLKALTAAAVAPTVRRHELLGAAGIPVAPVAAVTTDHVVVLRELRGQPLAVALFGPHPPCSAQSLVDLLDMLPPSAAELPARTPWALGTRQYAGTISGALPALGPRLGQLVSTITAGLAGAPAGSEATHGDFHEGQVFVQGGQVTGLLDVDRVGPGRRADDLGCLLAHLSTISGMSATQGARLAGVIREWRAVFDDRVDPTELRLRAAAVTLSLATGPYRTQRPGWQRQTETILSVAEQMAAAAR